MTKFKYHKVSKNKKIRFICNIHKGAPFIVFLHGFMSDLEGKKPNAFLKFAKKNKLSFLALEYSGHGKSSGEFIKGNIKSLSEICDIMIVIGSFTSANSKRLTELAKIRNERTFQVTSVEDLDIDWFQQTDTVGISAGASTPDNIINDVLEKIKLIGKVTEEELVYE